MQSIKKLYIEKAFLIHYYEKDKQVKLLKCRQIERPNVQKSQKSNRGAFHWIS